MAWGRIRVRRRTWSACSSCPVPELQVTCYQNNQPQRISAPEPCLQKGCKPQSPEVGRPWLPPAGGVHGVGPALRPGRPLPTPACIQTFVALVGCPLHWPCSGEHVTQSLRLVDAHLQNEDASLSPQSTGKHCPVLPLSSWRLMSPHDDKALKLCSTQNDKTSERRQKKGESFLCHSPCFGLEGSCISGAFQSWFCPSRMWSILQ